VAVEDCVSVEVELGVSVLVGVTDWVKVGVAVQLWVSVEVELGVTV